MEYRLKMDEETWACAVERREEGTLRLLRGEATQNVDYLVISAHHQFLVVDGVGYNAYVAADGPGKTVIIRGIPYYLEDADRQTTSRKGAQALPTEVTPPMPAVVVAVPVQVGDPVKQGDPVVVVTAMKMETTLTAPYDGRVAAVKVAVGDKVMPGQILVDIEKD
jgi:biotin carboxyl carrier protein